MADDLDGERPQFVVFGVGKGLRRGNHNGFARVDAQRVEVFHVADRDTVVVTVAHHLVLDLFPTTQRLLDQHLRRERERFLCQRIQFFLVVTETGTESAQGVRCTDDDGIAQVLGGLAGCLDILAGLRLDGFDIDLVEPLYKEFAVFGVDDGLHGGTENLHSVLLQHALAIERHAAVEGCLSAKREQNAVGALFLYHTLHEIGRHGQEVNLVGYALRGLHGGDVRVDKHGLDSFLTQGFQGLRAGVVELACLADLESTGA